MEPSGRGEAQRQTAPASEHGRGGSPFGELREPHVENDQTGAGIPLAVAFIVLVKRPGALCALGEEEPSLIMIFGSNPSTA